MKRANLLIVELGSYRKSPRKIWGHFSLENTLQITLTYEMKILSFSHTDETLRAQIGFEKDPPPLSQNFYENYTRHYPVNQILADFIKILSKSYTIWKRTIFKIGIYRDLIRSDIKIQIHSYRLWDETASTRSWTNLKPGQRIIMLQKFHETQRDADFPYQEPNLYRLKNDKVENS